MTSPGIYVEDGVIYGFAVVSEVNGEPVYWGAGNTYVPSGQQLLKAAMHFAQDAFASDSVGKVLVNHEGESVGQLLFAWPLNPEINAAMGISCPLSGLLVGVKVDEATLSKFESGELTGLSPHVNGQAEVTEYDDAD